MQQGYRRWDLSTGTKFEPTHGGFFYANKSTMGLRRFGRRNDSVSNGPSDPYKQEVPPRAYHGKKDR
jgi:hypothetical protein